MGPVGFEPTFPGLESGVLGKPFHYVPVRTAYAWTNLNLSVR